MAETAELAETAKLSFPGVLRIFHCFTDIMAPPLRPM